MTRPHASLPLLLLLLASCGDDEATVSPNENDSGQVESDAQVGDDGEAADRLRAAIGTFGVELIAPVPATDTADARPGASSIVGRVYEAMPPSSMPWSEVDQAGDCRLFEPLNPFCDPACGSSQVCIESGTCVAPPAPLDVGLVTLTGLGDEALEMSPLPPSNTYQPRGTSGLPYPPFAENDLVALAAEGGELLPFELEARGIAPLEVLSTSPIQFDPDAATVVRWTPAGSNAGSRIVVTVDISHHGGRKGELVCETDDDGELELPAALVQGLIDLGVAGFPSLEVARESTSVPLERAPGLSLKIFSSVDLALEIPGYISCMPEDEDACPEGQTCLVTHVCG